MRPVILTNAFVRPRGTRLSSGVVVSEKRNVYACVEDMVRLIRDDMGGTPLLLPTAFDEETVAALLDHVHGIFLPGAVSNVHPSLYGEAVEVEGQTFDPAHDRTDLFLIRQARAKGIPFLGICRSMQMMNIAFGGSLYQSVPAAGIDHHCSDSSDGQTDHPDETHTVVLSQGGLLQTHLGVDEIRVNSLHGQGVKAVGRGLRVEARAPDDLVEALSCPEASAFFAAVQWHPEDIPDHPASRVLFDLFRQAASARAGQGGG